MQVLSGGSRIWTQADWLQSPCSKQCYKNKSSSAHSMYVPLSRILKSSPQPIPETSVAVYQRGCKWPLLSIPLAFLRSSNKIYLQQFMTLSWSHFVRWQIWKEAWTQRSLYGYLDLLRGHQITSFDHSPGPWIHSTSDYNTPTSYRTVAEHQRARKSGREWLFPCGLCELENTKPST